LPCAVFGGATHDNAARQPQPDSVVDAEPGYFWRPHQRLCGLLLRKRGQRDCARNEQRRREWRIGRRCSAASFYKGGKVYFIIQSVASGGTDLEFSAGSGSNHITSESQISWQNAQLNNYRFDSFEVSLESNAGDEGDLTEINGFGIPMEVSVTYQDGSPTQTRGYNIDGTTVFNLIKNINPGLVGYNYTEGPLAGKPRMALSPAEAVGEQLPGASPQDWANYVQSLENTSTPIQIAGLFDGAPSADLIQVGSSFYINNVYHNPDFYSYSLSYDSGQGVFLLTPAANSQIKGTISITPEDLENSVYQTLGNANILDVTSSGTTVFLADMNTGANTQWGAVFPSLLIGLDAGYLGGSASQLNPLLGSTPVDLNKVWNFEPNYAFGGMAGGPAVAPAADVFFDAFTKIFFQHANAYGTNYSDALMNAFSQGGPLISVANSDGTNVSGIDITLFDDNEPSPALGQGYTVPVLANVNFGPYVAPQASTVTLSTGLSLQLDFNEGAAYGLAAGDSVSIGFYTGIVGGLAQFDNVTLPGTPDGSGSGSLFQRWEYVSGGGSGSFTALGNPGGATLFVSGLPYATGVNWYQVTVANGATSKTFNFYLDAVAGSGVINPNVISGGMDNSEPIAVDGFVQLVGSNTSSSYLSALQFQMIPGGAISLD